MKDQKEVVKKVIDYIEEHLEEEYQKGLVTPSSI